MFFTVQSLLWMTRHFKVACIQVGKETSGNPTKLIHVLLSGKMIGKKGEKNNIGRDSNKFGEIALLQMKCVKSASHPENRAT